MRKSKGFTLIELLIGLSVGTAVLGTVAAVFVPSLTTYRNNQALSTIQESERFIVSTFSSAVTQAGFSGCDSREPNTIANAAVLPTNPWIQAFDEPAVITEAGEEAEPNGYLSAPAEALRPDATGSAFPAGDVLTLLTTGVSAFSLANHNSANQTVTLRGDASELEGKLITLDDCNSTAIFEVGAPTVTTAAGVTTTLFSYSADNTANCNAEGVTPAQVLLGSSGENTNCNDATTRGNFSAYNYDPGANAAEVVATSFFIGTPGDGIPSLYSVSASPAEVSGFTDPVRLVSGVDNMRVRYGLRNANTSIDYFTATTFVGDLADVVTLEVSFILNSGVTRSVRGNPEEAQVVNFLALDNNTVVDCDGTQTSDNDLSACPIYMSDSGVASGQLRRTITKVFNIRNIPI